MRAKPRGSIVPLARAIVLAAGLALLPSSLAALDFPSSWDFGSRREGERISWTFVVTNDERSAVSLRLLSSCPCLSLLPERLVIPAGSRASVEMVLDLTGLSGSVTRMVVVAREGSTRASDGILWINGSVEADEKQVPAGEQAACEWCNALTQEFRQTRTTPGVVEIWCVSGSTDPVVASYIAAEVLRIVTAHGGRFVVRQLDVRDVGGLRILAVLQDRFPGKVMPLPMVVVGDVLVAGDRDVRKRLAAVLEESIAPGNR